MDHAFRALVVYDEPATAPRCTTIETWLAECAASAGDSRSGSDHDDEAEYCRARAEVEILRAREAAHPAAREAHLQMAMLYRQRALVGDQGGVEEIQDWEGEGGSHLAE